MFCKLRSLVSQEYWIWMVCLCVACVAGLWGCKPQTPPSTQDASQASTPPTTQAPDAAQAPPTQAATMPTTHTSAPDASEAPKAAQEDPQKRAQGVVEMFRDGKVAEVRALFSPDMLAALSEPQTAAIWPSIVGLAGQYKGVLVARTDLKDGFTIVSLTCDFETLPISARIVFDANNKLAGLNFVPATDPSAFGPRPQTPKPPFPYSAEDVTYPNPADQSTLAGTLTLPSGDGPHPAVILITGSGAQDRDETIFGHKPFFVIADRLTRDGVAVLRVDDRGIGGTTGDPKNATIQTHATDVQAGVAFLKSNPKIDPKRIGLIGHSEGGIIAALVASNPDNGIAFIVSLAGTGLAGNDINLMQMEAIMRADASMSPEAIQEIMGAQRAIIDLVIKGAPEADITAAILAAQKLSIKHTLTQKPDEKIPSDAELQAVAVTQTQTLLSPWFISFLKTNPADAWKTVTCPALAMIGTKDLQVPADANLAAIAAANPKVKIEKLQDLNHLFQKAETGLIDEYAKIQQTFDPLALDLMGAWVKQQAGLQNP